MVQHEILRKLLEEPFGLAVDGRKLLETSAQKGGDAGSRALAQVDKDLAQRAGNRWITEIIRGQENIEDIIERTDAILNVNGGEESKEATEEVDHGWISNFMDGAGRTFNDKLKDYWAKLLAGEIKKPGTNSARLVELMKKLSVNDAERIKKICPYVVYNGPTPHLLRFEKEPYDFHEMRFLIELGLLDPSNDIVKLIKKRDIQVYLYHGRIGLIIHANNCNHDLAVYSFTELGKEFLNIIDDYNVNIEFLKRYAKYMIEHENPMEFTCGEYITELGRIRIPIDKQIFRIPEVKGTQL